MATSLSQVSIGWIILGWLNTLIFLYLIVMKLCKTVFLGLQIHSNADERILKRIEWRLSYLIYQLNSKIGLDDESLKDLYDHNLRIDDEFCFIKTIGNKLDRIIIKL